MVSGRWYNGGMARRSIAVMEANRETLLTHLAAGHTRRTAAMLTGIDEETVRRWEKGDVEYAARIRDAELKACAVAEQSLVAAVSEDWRAAVAYLERRARADWGKQVQVEQSGALEITVVRKVGRTGDNRCTERARYG